MKKKMTPKAQPDPPCSMKLKRTDPINVLLGTRREPRFYRPGGYILFVLYRVRNMNMLRS